MIDYCIRFGYVDYIKNHRHEGGSMRFSTDYPAKCIVLFLMFTAHLSAQWSTDPAVNNAISMAAGNQTFPQIVSDGAGGAIITWDDLRSGSGNHDIYAQRINAAGTVMWTTDGVAISVTLQQQSSPAIVSDGVGGAIIAWNDSRSSNSGIYVQRIDASGAVQWQADGVALLTNSSTQSFPLIVSDGAAGAIIMWQDTRNGNYDIYARRIDAAGVVQWAADGVAISTAAFDQTSPTIVSDGAGGAIITWCDFRSNTTDDIYAQRINGAGTVQWTVNGVAISTATGNQTFPTIVSDGAAGAIITWQDSRSGNNDIYAQHVDALGAVSWTADGVAICTETNYQFQPTIVSDGAGGAIITWNDLRSGTNYDIYARRINAAGVAQWTVDGVAISTAVDDQTLPAIVSDGAGGAIITWVDHRGGNYDVYAQHITAAGAVPWTANGVAIANAANTQFTPTIVSDGAGGAIITWHDYRIGATSDIYASKIGSAGVLPVELASFSASSKLNGVELKWTTATEVNNYGFEIERSENVKVKNEKWERTGFVKGSGTTNAPKEYSFTEKNLSPGRYAYRIKQIDRDGSFNYYGHVEVEITASAEFALGSNFPNPFNPATTFSFSLPSTSFVSLKVFDALGREVSVVVSEELSAGAHARQWDAAGLPSGMYFYRLQAGSFTETKKLLLLR